MSVLSIDLETYCDLDLKQVGSSRYTRHPSFEILMAAYAVDGGPVEQWVPAEGEPIPEELLFVLTDKGFIKRAWNAAFEIDCLRNSGLVEADVTQWRCTMVTALTCSLPGSLEKAGEVIGLYGDKKKDSRGKTLIRTFSIPQKKVTKKHPNKRIMPADEPDMWEEYKAYNRQDVEAERAILDVLKDWDLPEHEWDLWHLDRQINSRGIPVNMTVVDHALSISDELTGKFLDRMQKITGLENPNSGVQLLPWLRDNGYPFDDLKKGHIQRARDAAKSEEYKEVLYLRKETSRISIKKFNALRDATDQDGRIRNTHQFAAAGRTWRWGGRKYQPQNLAIPAGWISPELLVRIVKDVESFHCADAMSVFYGEDRVIDCLSACVRPVIQAKEGHVFVDADLNAIENRVLGWLSDDDEILGVFERGEDPYIAFGVHLYGVPYAELYAEYKAGDKRKRTICKPGSLGCGYMLSAGRSFENETTGELQWTGLMGYARNMGVQLSQEEANLSVEVWRETYHKAKAYWYEIHNAMFDTIKTGRSRDAGHVWFDKDGPMLRMHLPSGRCLHYVRPQIEHCMMPWGDERLAITYEEENEKGQWIRVTTHPGKVTENGDQAISRDILANGLRQAHRRGLDVCMHVHDQIVAEVREDQADKWLKILEECMEDQEDLYPWTRGLPLAAKGSISKYFIKD